MDVVAAASVSPATLGTATWGESALPWTEMLCVAPVTLSALSVRPTASLSGVPGGGPPTVGVKSMVRGQTSPGVSGVPIEQSFSSSNCGKSNGKEIVVKSSAAFPTFWTETVCGLLVLVLPSYVAAKLKEGGCDWLTQRPGYWYCRHCCTGRCRCGRGCKHCPFHPLPHRTHRFH